MAKKDKKVKKISQPKQVVRQQTWLAYLGAALMLTLLAMIPVFSTELLNYDDELYISQNPFIQGFDIGALFTEIYQNQYSPVAMMLMALQYKMGFSVGMLKGVSVLWHLMNTALVFVLVRKLFKKEDWAFFVAALFGVATVQLESVAWLAASMKIGTYAFFFLWSIYLYLRYLDAGEKKFLFASVVVFLLSCLCKEQAVALAPTLILIDYFKKRDWLSGKVLMEKGVYFLLAIGFGLLTLKASAAAEAKQTVFEFGLGERMLFAGYTLGSYITKLTVPFNLSFFYTYPVKGAIPPYFYSYTVLFLGLLAVLIQAIRKGNRSVVFALLFFGINIGLTILTQLLSVRDVIMADRYVYIPAIGWFLFLAYVLENFVEKRVGRVAVQSFGLFLIVGMTGVTFLRGSVWKNSISIFTDVIEKEAYTDSENPYLALPYNNRGIAYRRNKKIDLAIKDFNSAIDANQNYPSGFMNRGNISFNRGDNKMAMKDYKRTLELEPTNAKALSARGAIYAQQGQTERAFQDLNKAIDLDPYFKDALSNRGLIHLQQQDFPKAIADFSTILKFSPTAHEIISTRGVAHARANMLEQSLQDHTKAIQLLPTKGSYYLNRAYTYNSMGNRAAALQDAEQAAQLGVQVSKDFMSSLR